MAAHLACGDPPSPTLLQGIRQFNRRQFFEQHETLELLWRAEPGPLRDLYKGILQVGVGFYHLQRGNYIGAAHLLERGLARLPPFAPACLGIDVARLIAEAGQCYHEVVRLGPQHLYAFPWPLVPSIHTG